MLRSRQANVGRALFYCALFVKPRLRGAMEWFGVASVLFAIAINHFTVTANLEAATSGEEARLSSGFLWALGIYMAWTLAWVGRLLWSFRQPPDENAAIGPA